MNKINKLVFYCIFLSLSMMGSPVFAEEKNNQHSNDCRNEPSPDKVNFCNAMSNKDGTACNKIKSFELKSHCLIMVADFSRSKFHTYTSIAPPKVDK
jgi:hypothetical protein